MPAALAVEPPPRCSRVAPDVDAFQAVDAAIAGLHPGRARGDLVRLARVDEHAAHLRDLVGAAAPAEAAGLIEFAFMAVDGTKLKANASPQASDTSR